MPGSQEEVATSARRQPTRKSVAQSSSSAAKETPGGDVDFSQALEQQITQAIQPALDEFRQRMKELSGQMVAMPTQGAGQSDISQKMAQEPAAQVPSKPTQQSTPRQEPEPPATPEADAKDQARDSQPQPTLVPVRNIQHSSERLLTSALSSAVQKVGNYSEQWLQSMLVAGLGALLAEPTHAAIQKRAEQGFHTLLQKAFEAAPPDFANQEMREKVEHTLQLILRETLGAVFAEDILKTVQVGSQQIIQQALRGDFDSAMRKIEEVLRVILAALIAVLGRYQQTIRRLLLGLVLLAVSSSLEQAGKTK